MSTLSLWTIYDHPRDHPEHVVVRRFQIGVGGISEPREVHLCASLAEARAYVPEGTFRVPRSPTDDPVIVETWL